jgi:hypothetical protein
VSTVTIELPDYWEKMNVDETHREVLLMTGCKEFLDVEENAKKTAQGTIAEILVCS